MKHRWPITPALPAMQVTATALRGAFQSCGQNCAGAERFIVAERVSSEGEEKCGVIAQVHLSLASRLGVLGSRGLHNNGLHSRNPLRRSPAPPPPAAV